MSCRQEGRWVCLHMARTAQTADDGVRVFAQCGPTRGLGERLNGLMEGKSRGLFSKGGPSGRGSPFDY